MNKILSLDYSTKSGVAVIDLNNGTINLCTIWGSPRLQSKFFEKQEYNVIVSEGQFRGPSSKTSMDLSKGLGYVLGRLSKYMDFDHLVVAQATSRSFNGVNKKDLKEKFPKVKERSIMTAQKHFRITYTITDDEADALLQGRFLCHKEYDIDITAFEIIYEGTHKLEPKPRLAMGRSVKL